MLYEIGVDAEKQGETMTVVSTDNEIVIQITGIGRPAGLKSSE